MNEQDNYKIELLNSQLMQTQQQLEMIGQQELEMHAIVASIDELKTVEIDSEVLVPLANGIFVKAKLLDNSKFLLNIGGNVTTFKDGEDTKKIILTQIEELQKTKEHLLQDYQNLIVELQKIQS